VFVEARLIGLRHIHYVGDQFLLADIQDLQLDVAIEIVLSTRNWSPATPTLFSESHRGS